MKTKKILSIALAVLMLIGTFAVGASAESEIKDTDVIIAGNIISGLEESYWLTVDGALTADGASASNYNIAITPATGDSAIKITLNNAQISKVSDISVNTYCAIYTVQDLDIELKGTNKFDILPESEATIYGIFARILRIYGGGSLELDSGNEWTVGNTGVYGGIIEISGDANVKFNLKAIHRIMGVIFEESIVISDNANLEINEFFLGNTEAEYTVGEDYIKGCVYADGFYSDYGTVTLSDNANVTVNMLNTDYVVNRNQGFDIENDLKLSGNSNLTVNGTDGMGNIGIEIKNGNITVEDAASINVETGDAYTKVDYGVSYGIYLYNSYDVSGKAVTVSDNAKIIVTSGDAAGDCLGFYAEAKLVATDNAYISATSGSTDGSSSDAYGVCFTDGIELSGKAKLIGRSGSNTDENYGIGAGYVTVCDDAVIEGYAGIGRISVGVFAGKNITVSGNAELTGESLGTTEEVTAGVYSENLLVSGNAVINAEGGNGKNSYGLGSEEITVCGSAEVNATSGKASEYSVGICAEDNTFVIEDNATVNAKSGKGFVSYAINASEGDGIVIRDNAVVVAEASEGTMHSFGIYTVNLTAKDNANVRSTGTDSDEYSFGIVGFEMNIGNEVTVEATGNNSALYSQEFTMEYDEPYILVSTDTNPENAVVYNGTDLLASYEDESCLYESEFKYVFIASEEPADPDAPEEPAPELNFFEQLIADIVSFFNSIVEFFSSLFSFSF